MKKFTLLFVLALMALANGHAFADLEWADPSLCVAGKWLVIESANSDGVRVTVPRDVPYGDQTAGGCTTAAPAQVLPSSAVTVRGEGGLHVTIDGRQASPMVTVLYDGHARTHKNDGGRMEFHFSLDAKD